MSEKVKGYIRALFAEMNEEIVDIVKKSSTSADATQSIAEYVSDEINTASEGYVKDLYGELSKKTLSEDVFKDPANANRFYALQMRQRLSEECQFEIRILKASDFVAEFNEINRTIATAGATVISAALGSAVVLGSAALIGVIFWGTPLAGIASTPKWVFLAGAALGGIAGGYIACEKAVPAINKKNFLKAANTSMQGLEAEFMKWVDDVTEFYNKPVEELKKTLGG